MIALIGKRSGYAATTATPSTASAVDHLMTDPRREIGAVDCGCYVRETGVPGGYRAAWTPVSGLSLACPGEMGLGIFASTRRAPDRI
jgi:hypothetical protein